MINPNNQYTEMQKNMYHFGTSNHKEHNSNPDYWDILLSDIKDSKKWEGKFALDFACGKGRNVINLHSLSNWGRVDGVDLSENNINFCKAEYKNINSNWYCNNGIDLKEIKDNQYDFVLSTIALQHIPVYDIRKNILNEILRILKPEGIFSFQLGFGKDLSDPLGRPRSSYYENSYTASGTNGNHDFRVLNENEVIEDLTIIGFKNIKTTIRKSYSDLGHPEWIYVNCKK